MSAILVPSLYAMSGVCAFAALHHWLAVMRGQMGHIHNLFVLLCLLIMALILAKAGGYQTQTVEALIALRKWEVSAICLFFVFFPWFIAEYSGVHPRKLLVGLSVFWGALFAINLSLPYGVQHADLPSLTYLHLPWGERVVDLRVLQPSIWHRIGQLGVLTVMAFSFYACVTLYRNNKSKRAQALASALGLFFGSMLFNWAANLGVIQFVHLTEFGFLSLLVLMDLELMLESRDQGRRMHAVLDHLPAAVCLKDLTGRFKLVNRKYETVFHTNEAAIAGKNVFDLFSRDQAEVIDANERLALETLQDVESVEVLECKGEPRTFQSIKFPMLRRDGTAYAVGGVYIDVTESLQKDAALNKFRRQVWHADRVASTGAITGSLAHELSQPLSAILNNAQAGLRFLAQSKVDLNEIRDLLQDIVRDDKRAASVINGLRAMLQQQETPYADINLAQCLEEVIELLHSEIVRRGVEVERMLETGLTTRANKTQIQQVALNLMINALEAMEGQPAGQRILQLKATRADGKALVSVRDTGIGIAEDMLDRVFDGFYTTKPQGLGVGLEVCRSIMESHCGAIWVEANPDRGVTFHFSLPLATLGEAAGSSAGA